jgi:hypothetical protein
MRLESAQGLKLQLLRDLIEPFSELTSRLRQTGASAVTAAVRKATGEGESTVFGIGARPFESLPHLQRSVALGIARRRGEYRIAIRVQRPSLLQSPLMERLTSQAKGEVDVRVIGRLDKRAKAPATPWYQRNVRPLAIGASVGHVDVTAGTIGAFVKRGSVTYILSNNHVLANEDLAKAGDWILQRAAFDGGKQPVERVARLRFWVKLKPSGRNFVDAALAAIEEDIEHDAATLRAVVGGKNRTLAGLGPEFVDEGETVHKIGRTTGPTKGRVTAFDLDNVIVNYDAGNLRFDNQIEIEGTGTLPFSDGGDSGSMIVNADMQGVALLFAGGEVGGANGMGLTYANPMHRVLKDLKATLLPS